MLSLLKLVSLCLILRLDQVENNFSGEVARCLTVAVKFLNFKKKGRRPAGIRTDTVISEVRDNFCDVITFEPQIGIFSCRSSTEGNVFHVITKPDRSISANV